MAKIYAPMVKETATNPGTSTVSLGGAFDAAHQTFVGAGLSLVDPIAYAIRAVDGSGIPNGAWELTWGVLTDSSPDTLTRSTLINSSTGSRVNFTGDIIVYSINLPEYLIPTPGMSVLYDPLLPPVVPSAYDDEFTTNAADGKWTETSTPGGSFTVDNDRLGTFLCLESPGHASETRILDRRQALAGMAGGTAASVRVRMGLTSIDTGTTQTLFSVTDNSTVLTNNTLAVYIEDATGAVTLKVHQNGSVVATFTAPAGIRTWWVQIQRNTSNEVKIFVSHNGLTWDLIHSVTLTWDWAYNFVRMLGHNAGSAHTQHLIDFVRFGVPHIYAP